MCLPVVRQVNISVSLVKCVKKQQQENNQNNKNRNTDLNKIVMKSLDELVSSTEAKTCETKENDEKLS